MNSDRQFFLHCLLLNLFADVFFLNFTFLWEVAKLEEELAVDSC